MRCHAETDLASFGRVLPWLASEPVANNVLCTLIDAWVNGSTPIQPGVLWLSVADKAGELAGAAIRTPPRALLLSLMAPPAAWALAEHVAQISPEIPGVNGPIVATGAFRYTFAARTNATATPGMSGRIFRLDELSAPSGVPGIPRPATAADRDVLVSWSAAFSAEATPDHPTTDPAEPVDARLVGEDLLWLWEVDGDPVSTAWLSPPVADVSRISGVYTPPAARGHGYASACVAAASRSALDRGTRICMLYTDLANPTSNKIYQQIGYRPYSDVQEWRFEPPPTRSI